LNNRIVKEIPLDQIDIDRIPYGLISLNYANNLNKGSKFPPIHVARLNNGRYKMLDGRHRYLAHKMCNKKYIKAKFSFTILKEKN
jgi:hypothetical protein